MARRPSVGGPGSDQFADLAKKTAILEREMAVQREALERLKALGQVPRIDVSAGDPHPSGVVFDRL
jgi:hypothetical protein